MTLFYSEEGYVSFKKYKTWYGVIGEEKKHNRYPLLCLHGGPGATHDYLTPIGKLSEQGRRVIFYDQLGAGNSDHPDNPEMWTVELYVEELGVVREKLGLKDVHILGQSWGGQLALEYILTKPTGVRSLILADSLADMDQWVSEANRLRSELPKKTQDVLDKHERDGTIDALEYEEATMEFYRRHVCRLPKWPPELNKTFEKFSAHPQVYNTMWGPNEFNVTGSLKDWSVVDRLNGIDVPTLILSGRYDESTPLINKTLNDGINDSEWMVFEKSSHMPHLEESEAYLTVLGNFLNKIESN
jgi:L-proline amide hydrolase